MGVVCMPDSLEIDLDKHNDSQGAKRERLQWAGKRD